MTSAFANGKKSTYSYRPDGLRVNKTVNGATTRHVLDGQNVSMDLNEDWSTKFSFVRGVRLVGYVDGANSSNYFYNFNAHGDVLGAIGGNNSTVQTRYTYDAFGNASRTGSSANPFQYCGEYTDDETGLIYLRARYYDPAIGSFISEDPARDGMNWYSYCDANPVMFVDPFGLDAIIITNDGQDGTAVGFGHTSAIYQDENGEWYFTYWGDTAAAVIHIPAEHMQSLAAFNAYLQTFLSENGFGGITDTYTHATYVVGDFTESLNSAVVSTGGLQTDEPVKAFNFFASDKKQIIFQGKNKSYSLITHNCLQQTMEDFGKGTLAGGIETQTYLNSFYGGGVIPRHEITTFIDMFMNESFTLAGAYPSIREYAYNSYGSGTEKSVYAYSVVMLMWFFD